MRKKKSDWNCRYDILRIYHSHLWHLKNLSLSFITFITESCVATCFETLPCGVQKSSSFIQLEVTTTGWNCDWCWFRWWMWKGRYCTCNKWGKCLIAKNKLDVFHFFPQGVISPFLGIWLEFHTSLFPGNFIKGHNNVISTSWKIM